MTYVSDLDVERQVRRSGNPPDVVPSADERDAYAFARGEGAAGRVRALRRHPDLADDVRRAYKHTDFGQWSGYVPPRTCNGEYNDSPQRRAVVVALAAAYRRETTPTRQEGQ